MADIAMKSCKFSIKCDNGYTATGRVSTKTYSYKGANPSAEAEDIHTFFDAAFNLGTLPVLTTSEVDEYLVAEEI